MVTSGVPLKIVSEVLGHASISITADVYSHVSPSVARDALDQLGTLLASGNGGRNRHGRK
jgi:site-specific recombinase XerD